MPKIKKRYGDHVGWDFRRRKILNLHWIPTGVGLLFVSHASEYLGSDISKIQCGKDRGKKSFEKCRSSSSLQKQGK